MWAAGTLIEGCKTTQEKAAEAAGEREQQEHRWAGVGFMLAPACWSGERV